MSNPKRSSDPNQKSNPIVDIATGASEDIDPDQNKNPVLVSNVYQVINSLLSEREKSLTILKKKILEVKSEIRVLKQTKALNDIRTKQRLKPERVETRGRKLDKKWKNVLQFIGRHDGVSVDEVMEYIELNNYPISKPNLHVQLNSYFKKDWVRRTTQGTYDLTESGMKRSGFSEYGES